MLRRDFLRSGFQTMSAFLAGMLVPRAAHAAQEFRNIKISAVDVFPLKAGSIFVLVRTSEGITGYGECSPMNVRVITSMLKDSLVPIVVGKNPLDIGRLWDGRSARSNIRNRHRALGHTRQGERTSYLAAPRRKAQGQRQNVLEHWRGGQSRG